MELYRYIWRDEPQEFWWWYMDGGEPDGPLRAREVIQVPVAIVAEESDDYVEEVRVRDQR